MSEIAIVSARPLRLKKLAEDGNAGAQAAIKISEKPDRFLSTVQIGITLVGVFSGAFGGAALAVHLSPLLERSSVLAPYSETISFALVVLSITYLSLVIGELVPKKLALRSPETISSRIARPMNFISKMTAPVGWFLSSSANSILTILRRNTDEESTITEEEIKSLIIQGTTAGIFEETEQELMQSVIRLDDQNITALMTPRTKIGWINIEDAKREIPRQILNYTFSRLLVCRGDLDNIIGFVKARDILNLLLNGESLDLEILAKQPIFIPESLTALETLERFRDSNTNFGVIIDEFGSTHGIVTTEDILTAIVGDLPAGGILSESAVQRKDGSWLLDGRLSNSDFCDILNIRELPEEEHGMYETLAGFIIKRLEKLPVTGDSFDWNDYVFEVIDMDGRRVDRVLVIPPKITIANSTD